MVLDGIRLGSGLEAYRLLQFFKARLGLVQLLVQLLAISQAFQLKLGQFDVVNSLLGFFLDFLTALYQLLVSFLSFLATLFQLVLQAVELLLHLVVGLAVETQASQECIAAVFLRLGSEIRSGFLGSLLGSGLTLGSRLALGRGLLGSSFTLGGSLALGGSLLGSFLYSFYSTSYRYT